MGNLKRFTIGAWLAIWFILWPGIAFGFGCLIWGLEVQTWHLIAYFMQAGAFSIILARVNSLYKFNHVDNWGFIRSIWEWIKSFSTKKSEPREGGIISQSPIGTMGQGYSPLPKNSTKDEIIRWLNKEIKLLYSIIGQKSATLNHKITTLETNLNNSINSIWKHLKSERKVSRNVYLLNLERELVAVLWLIIAVGIFAFTNLVA